MAIIDPTGLFSGDRLRHCSNIAQLHWPRLFLASDGFGRLELNYARIVGRAYTTFSPIPTEGELQEIIGEYITNYLLFPFQFGAQAWGAWDTKSEYLPRYKTSIDRRSPAPPEPEFTEWKRRYSEQITAFPKSFSKLSEEFLLGVGVGGGIGIGKDTCASAEANARLGDTIAPLKAVLPEMVAILPSITKIRETPTPSQEKMFADFWSAYDWRRDGREEARLAFRKHVTSEEQFKRVMAALKAQRPEQIAKDQQYRPMAATWLNKKRWTDEPASAAVAAVPQQNFGRGIVNDPPRPPTKYYVADWKNDPKSGEEAEPQEPFDFNAFVLKQHAEKNGK
jgi:hypothetical protein